VYEALFHAGVECGVEVELIKIDSSSLEEAEKTNSVLALSADGVPSIDGVLVPGGFGLQGINGMVQAVAWARTNKVPCFGICLGMQVMVIEWARNMLGWADADSAEFNQNSGHLVICQSNMRLGAGESVAEPGSHIFAAYGLSSKDGKAQIWERHRHCYELANKYRADMAESGLKMAALALDGDLAAIDSLVDCIEWPEHPWGVGVQFHPEYKSKPTAAAPLFRDFIAAAKKMSHKP
jgi:CTP synthase